MYGAEAITSVTYDLSGNGRSAILSTKGAVTVIAAVDGPVLACTSWATGSAS